MKWTSDQLVAYQARFNEMMKNETSEETPDPGLEKTLQGKIVKHCKELGYPCLSFRQSKKAKGFLLPGWPDVTIALPGTRTIYLELKSASGTLRADQKLIAQMLLMLGHEWYKVKSFRRFLEILLRPSKAIRWG